jgi:hypothetical protein
MHDAIFALPTISTTHSEWGSASTTLRRQSPKLASECKQLFCLFAVGLVRPSLSGYKWPLASWRRAPHKCTWIPSCSPTVFCKRWPRRPPLFFVIWSADEWRISFVQLYEFGHVRFPLSTGPYLFAWFNLGTFHLDQLANSVKVYCSPNSCLITPMPIKIESLKSQPLLLDNVPRNNQNSNNFASYKTTCSGASEQFSLRNCIMSAVVWKNPTDDGESHNSSHSGAFDVLRKTRDLPFKVQSEVFDYSGL